MDSEDEIRIETDGSEEPGESELELEERESREGAKLAKLKKELEGVKKEKQDYLDGWQRAKADYANLLRRLDEEKAAAKAGGFAKAVLAFIPVLDSVAHARSHGSLPEGFEAIAKQLETAARELGLVEFGAVGEAFDPELHEALGQDPMTDEAPEDTVTAVLQSGWKLGERVVRAAKVRVAHGS